MKPRPKGLGVSMIRLTIKGIMNTIIATIIIVANIIFSRLMKKIISDFLYFSLSICMPPSLTNS